MQKTKQPIDIEALLQWTFRHELPKGRPVESRAWDNLEYYFRYGTRIDRSHNGGGDALGFTPGEAHEDAKRVARAVDELSNDQSFADVESVRALVRDFDVAIVDCNGAVAV